MPSLNKFMYLFRLNFRFKFAGDDTSALFRYKQDRDVMAQSMRALCHTKN